MSEGKQWRRSGWKEQQKEGLEVKHWMGYKNKQQHQNTKKTNKEKPSYNWKLCAYNILFNHWKLAFWNLLLVMKHKPTFIHLPSLMSKSCLWWSQVHFILTFTFKSNYNFSLVVLYTKTIFFYVEAVRWNKI